ncbi:MAG: Rieske 2Fe-2S domain-containing protein [Gammaproteobacteria bacterium]
MTLDLVSALEHAQTIDKVANPVADGVNKVIPAGPVKDVLSGTRIGHPVHPILTDVAIGTLTSAVILDVVGGESAEAAADRLIGVGLAAVVPTAVTGLSDWSDTWGKGRRIGMVHAGVNVVASACFAGSLAVRRSGARGAGKALALAGMGIMTLGGYLGGHLTFRKGVGVDETTFDEGPTEWTQLFSLDELPEGSPTTATVDGVTILLYRTGAKVAAIHNRCSHRGGPLNEGGCDGRTVTCPWHGSIFALESGRILRGPAIAPQPRFEVRVTAGKVEVRRDPSELHG